MSHKKIINVKESKERTMNKRYEMYRKQKVKYQI